jgi:hypothetical protein
VKRKNDNILISCIVTVIVTLLVSTTEELLGRNSSGSGLENREYGPGYPLR